MSEPDEMKQWISRVLDEEFHVLRDLVPKQWIVVPVESGSHFDDNDIDKIAFAVQSVGVKMLQAILLEDLTNINAHFEFTGDANGIQMFNKTCGPFNFAICPNNRSFLIVCTTYDYYALAGSREFVELALGTSIEEGQRKFDDFADQDCWSSLERTELLSVANRYREWISS